MYVSCTCHNFCTVWHCKRCIIMGSLIVGSVMDASLQKRSFELKRATDCLHRNQAHDSLILLKACYDSLKFTHLLHSTPCANHNILLDINALFFCLCLVSISNANINDMQWQQTNPQINAWRSKYTKCEIHCSSSISCLCFQSKTASKSFNIFTSNMFSWPSLWFPFRWQE